MNNYEVELKNLINFGIKDSEELTREERIKRMTSFRNSLSIQKYANLFQNISEDLLNDKIDDKGKVIDLLIEFIRSYSVLEDNIEKMPKLIITLYKSHMNLIRLIISLELIENLEFVVPKPFTETALNYLDYLDNEENQLYINYNYEKIAKFNKRLFQYLEKKDENNCLYQNSIDNDLINTLNSKLNSLKHLQK